MAVSSMTSPTSELSVFRMGAAAMTVVCSSKPPTSSRASTRARSFTWSTNFSRTHFLKPGASTVTE